MRITRRRTRRPAALVTQADVRAVLTELRERLPDITPRSDKQLVAMLRATRHIERYPATDTKRGRPSPWRRIDLLQLATVLREILDRATDARLSLASFVDHYLRLLDLPADLLEAFERGDINLFEAEQLARISPGRLEITPAEARARRAEVLQAHLLSRASGTRLRMRVRELLGEGNENATIRAALIEEEEFELLDPSDTTHLFYDEIRRLLAALKKVRPEDLSDDLLDDFLRASDGVWNVLARIERRKPKAEPARAKLTI
jgi:hypothetical protein